MDGEELHVNRPIRCCSKGGCGRSLAPNGPKWMRMEGCPVRPAVVIRGPATAQVSDTLEDRPGLGVPATMKIARTSIDQPWGAMGGAGYLLV
jgi:hypothetical protein